MMCKTDFPSRLAHFPYPYGRTAGPSGLHIPKKAVSNHTNETLRSLSVTGLHGSFI